MKIKGTEWENLSTEEKADAIQNYVNSFSQDDSFLNFIIFGKRPVRQMLAQEGARGLKIMPSLRLNPDTGKPQLFPILIATDKFGNELPFEYDPNEEQTGEIQIMGDTNPPPVKCPTACT